jgi:hypothetical protein
MRRLIILITVLLLPAAVVLMSCSDTGNSLTTRSGWTPETDWGHWRLGHRNTAEFLEENKFTVTFAPGAPNFEQATRAEFDEGFENAKEVIKDFHDRGYIVLRYMTSSIHGTTETSEDEPKAELLDLYDFYYSGAWSDFEEYLGPKPPDEHNPATWVMRRPDGSYPHYRYAPYGQEKTGRFELWGCPNNPYFKELMAAKLRAQADTGLDGVYLDWTQFATGTCYCDYCVSDFRDYLAETLPAESAMKKYNVADFTHLEPPHESGDPFWMEWILFRANALADYHQYLRAEARKFNPDFMLSGNIYGGFGYGPIAYDAAGHMELFGREGGHDFFYSEIQEYLDTAPHVNEEGVRITNSPALKYLSAAARGKPVIIYATEITPPIFPNPTEQTLNAMALINIAESVANQSIFREKRETPPWATNIYNFLAGNSRSLVGSGLNGSVGIIASIHQYMADRQSYAFSFSRVLADEGIGHIFIVEDEILERDLSEFKVLVVPYLPLLSREQQIQLVSYVRNGGQLVVIGKSGMYDQNNVEMTDPPLMALYGSGFTGGNSSSVQYGDGTARFVSLPDASHNYLIEMKQTGSFTTFGPTLADRFADIPEGYTRGRIHPELRAVLQEGARQIGELNPSVSRLMSVHPFVEFNTMYNPETDQLLLHLVNYDVSINGEVNPAEKVQVRVELPAGKRVRSASFSGNLGPMASLDVQPSDNGRSVLLDLDEVFIYGLAVIDLR